MKWKNALIKAFLWIFSPAAARRKHPTTFEKFLIVSTTGLGDTLWGTPAIRALRKTYPDSAISVLTSSIGGSVLEHNKHIDELYVLGPNPFFSLFRFLPKMRRQKFDAILVFHTSQRMVLPFCALLEAPQLIGTEGINKDLDFLLTKALPKKHQHEIERRLDIAKQVGAYVSDFVLEEEEEKADRFLDGHGVPDHIPLVGIHPGAKNLFKQWPKESFIEVGKRLSQHLGCQIFITGDQSEALLVLEIASKIPGAIPIAGELDLSTFTAVLSRMDVFITNDTGPMHLAFAAKTPTVAIFGPTDPSLCGPFHVENVKVMTAPKTCRPCLGKSCQKPFCLLQLGPEKIYDAALSVHRSSARISSLI